MKKNPLKLYLCCLVHGLVSECARPRDNPNAPSLVDVPWHDANLALKQGYYIYI